MKAIIKEKKCFMRKKILSRVEVGTWNDFSEVTILYNDELGYCMRLSPFNTVRLTAVELRGIAKKIDEYNAQLKN